MENNKALIVRYKEEINHQLSDAATLKSLMDVTFKGLTPEVAKRAMLEGYFRGFKFEDFLKKDVYAVPFSSGYSLVTSIDFAQKRADATGEFAGATDPEFGMDEDLPDLPGGVYGKVTVFRLVKGESRPFSAKVYLKEYTTSKNLWSSKPRTMLGKVARMHALRVAFPEQLAKVYTEEEFEKENVREGSYTVVRRQDKNFEGEDIPDDAVVTSTGDDTPGIEGGTHGKSQVLPPQPQEIPADEEGQLNLLNAKAMKKWPDAAEGERLLKIKDLTGLGVEAKNYKTIIRMLD